jgi:peptidyl-prolyl cis-trans isomerase B (cyclophilin B)
MRAALLVLALVLALAAAGCGSDDDGEAGGETTTTETTTPAAGGECESVDAPEARDPEPREAPTEPLDDGTTYSLVVETNCGSFTIALDLELAPSTSASLVALAEDGYFDDTTFHRVVPGFVIQGGDPTGRGDGGPGYQTTDAPPSDAAYVKGVVAMAKSELEPAGTSGSQFFVVTGADIGLPADYAIVGEVTEGIDTVERIDALGQGNGPPSQPVVIETVTVEEG